MIKKVTSLGVALMLCFAMSALASASESGGSAATPETVMTALTTGLTAAQGQAMQGISNALPLALGIAGVILAVTIGYRIFKRMGKG